jgi:tetratricopeptide (TPR) repeat protein
MKASAAALMVVTVAIYLPALRGGFIWDDDDHLTGNSAVRSPDGLKRIWTSLAVSRYYPLTLTSFWAQHRLWGLRPLPYHAVNVALHVVNALLLWTLLRRLDVRAAWAAAAVWAVHPVGVETVAWITELKNTQSTFFLLLSLLSFLRFEDHTRRRDYPLALVCGAAAMLSKPSTVVLPGLVLLCSWWRRKPIDWLRILPFFVLALGMSALTIVEQRHHIQHEGTSEWSLTLAQRLALAGRAVWFYAGKLLFPVNLSFIYPRWELPGTWLPLAGLVIVAGTLWHFHQKRWARAAVFGLGCFVVALLPVLGFFDIYYFMYSFVADHFQYLASMALIALVVSAIPRKLAVAVPLMLAVLAWKQTHAYQSSESLWRDTLRKNPDAWMAHINLGSVHQSRGEFAEAMAHYEQARQTKADCVEAYSNLGNALLELGRVPEAIARCEEALRLKPDYADAHSNLGNALLRAGRRAEAIGHYEQALHYRPDHADAHNNLGVALAQTGQWPEAMAHWQAALQIRPDFVDAHFNLAAGLEQTGHVAEAMREYEQVLQLQPDHREARERLEHLRAAR